MAWLKFCNVFKVMNDYYNEGKQYEAEGILNDMHHYNYSSNSVEINHYGIIVNNTPTLSPHPSFTSSEDESSETISGIFPLDDDSNYYDEPITNDELERAEDVVPIIHDEMERVEDNEPITNDEIRHMEDDEPINIDDRTLGS